MSNTNSTNLGQQRPFCWPEMDGNKYPIYNMDEWLSVTSLQAGKLCQVFWRESKHINYRWKNFTAAKDAAMYAKTMIDNKAEALLYIGITAEQPTYPGAESAEFI